MLSCQIELNRDGADYHQPGSGPIGCVLSFNDLLINISASDGKLKSELSDMTQTIVPAL